ncbi:MAG: hypothetical protein JWN11_1143 [Hyphomicrobiales bacterium]|nr:hypothetical protein [Hyphomicrobiales bacterium]
MKIAGNVVGGILLVVGIFWALQGVNIIGGSALMSGHSQWLVIGVAVALVGFVVVLLTNMRARTGA